MDNSLIKYSDNAKLIINHFEPRYEEIDFLLSPDLVMSKKARSLLEREKVNLSRVKEIIEMGYEPITPPSHWYFGFFSRPGVFSGYNPYASIVRNMNFDKFAGSHNDAGMVRIFSAPIPKSAKEKIDKASKIFDGMSHIRVFSPNVYDFVEQSGTINSSGRLAPTLGLYAPDSKDPVVIARLDAGDIPYFFEIARWDLSKELEAFRAKSS